MMPFLALAADDADAIAPATVLVPGWMTEAVAQPAFVRIVEANRFALAASFALPMTMHQRLWNWPSLVGPINVAGTFPQMTETPKEIAAVDSGLSLPVMPAWPRSDDTIDVTPWYGRMDAVTIPTAQQEVQGQKSVWTRNYPTLPTWAPEIVGGMQSGSNVRFVITGVTKDSTGAAIASCTVYLFRVYQITSPNNPDPNSDPVLAVTTSDGSGNYSIETNGRGTFQLTAYKPGSPDLAGITVNTVMPSQV